MAAGSILSSISGSSPRRRGAFVLVALLAAASTLDAGQEVKRLNRPFATGDSQVLAVELPAGSLELLPHTGSAIEAELVLACSGDLFACREAASQVDLASKTEGERLTIGLEAPEKLGAYRKVWGSWSSSVWWTGPFGEGARHRSGGKGRVKWELTIELRVLYPRTQRLEVFLGEGEVQLSRLRIPVRLEMRRGFARFELERRLAGSINLEAKRGRNALFIPRTRPLTGRKVSWTEGEGPVDIDAAIDRGEAIVNLH